MNERYVWMVKVMIVVIYGVWCKGRLLWIYVQVGWFFSSEVDKFCFYDFRLLELK